MLDSATIHPLAQIVGSDNVLTGGYDLDRYSADALNPFRAYGAEAAFEQLAGAVVRPESTEQVAGIVSLAADQGITLIPYGGGTGVMGGTVPVRGGVIVDLSKMNRILEVNARDLTATVEGGVVIGELEEVLAEQGLMPGHDPYSVPIATVAGAISTNGVGYRAAAFGPMGNQVVALEVVLPDGRIVSTSAVPKYSSGPNLNHLFIGSEGVFGIITKATVRVFRLPETQVFNTSSFDSFGQGFDAAVELTSLGIRPSLLDLTEDEDGIRLHLLFEGYREGVAADVARVKEICAETGGRDIGPGPTMEYWQDRRQSAIRYKAEALGRPRSVRWNRWGSRNFDYLHMALPVSKVLDYRKRCDLIMADAGVQVAEYSLWSRPEFFSMMVSPDGADEDRFRGNLAPVVEQVLTLAQDMGGIMEYCHGVGVKLNHLLARELGVGHDVIRELKQTLDPANIMNPGKLGL